MAEAQSALARPSLWKSSGCIALFQVSTASIGGDCNIHAGFTFCDWLVTGDHILLLVFKLQPVDDRQFY